MKKIVMVGILLGSLNFAHAITAPISGNNALIGSYAYLWNPGVSAAILGSEVIDSAVIEFKNIKLTTQAPGSISVDFGSFVGISGYTVAAGGNGPFNSIPGNNAVTTVSDNDASGDAFNNIPIGNGSGTRTSLGTTTFLNNGYYNWSYTFTAAQLVALNSYITDGVWGFEIDPDCYFKVGSITFTYTQKIQSVPDTAGTFGLLGLATVGLLAFRRKVCLN